MDKLATLAEKVMVQLRTLGPNHAVFEVAKVTHMIPDLGDPTICRQVLDFLNKSGEIRANPGSESFTVTTALGIGPTRLIRKFCRRYYGEVSPLVDKKTISAVLKRHGAQFSLEDDLVQAELSNLEKEGLIRMVGREDGYLKMLGAE